MAKCPKCSGSMSNTGTAFFCEACQYREVRKDFRVRDERFEAFKAAMGKLAKRAVRIGVPAPSFIVGESEDVPEMETRQKEGRVIKDGDGKAIKFPTGIVHRFWPVTVAGAAPKFEGWSFLATIQHLTLDDGTAQNLLRVVPGAEVEIPSIYRDAPPDCVHCGYQRRRKDTYLLHFSGNHTVRQVGSTCIRDFLGHNSPEQLAAQAELLIEAMEVGEEGEEWGGGGTKRFSVGCFLGYVAAAMREGGWVSRRKANEMGGAATADIAYSSMLNPTGKNSVKPTDEDAARGVKALEWAKELHTTIPAEVASSDYLYNVNVVARCTMLGDRSSGIAASIISAYERSVAQEMERKHAPASNYIGTLGEKIVITVTILSIQEIESGYGPTRLHMMSDAEGNRFKWFASSGDIGKVGETVTIKGTVKKHDEWKGMKQTMLSRCSIYVEKVKKPRKKAAI